MTKVIHTKNAPAAIGPYSQGIKVGDMLFTSGQIPINPATGEIVAGGIKEQATQAFTNLKAIINESGAEMTDVVKTTVFVKDLADFGELNDVYASFFAEPFPARSCVEVARLPKDVLVEVEAIVIKK